MKIHSIAISIITSILLLSCNSELTPTCKDIVEIDLGNISKEHSTLSAYIILSNPGEDNDYTLKNVTLDIDINDNDAGTFVWDDVKEIPANSEIKVPITYKITPKDFVKGENANGTYTVSFDGTMSLKNKKTGDLVEVAIEKSANVIVDIKKEERQEERKAKKEERKERKEERKEGRNN